MTTLDPVPERRDKILRILALIEEGKSERAACIEVGMPRSMFRHWALKENMGEQYARALEALAQDQVEKLESAIEDMRTGVIDHNMARVEIDARRWFASKFLPKRYAEKIQQEISGPNSSPLTLSWLPPTITAPPVKTIPQLNAHSDTLLPESVDPGIPPQ